MGRLGSKLFLVFWGLLLAGCTVTQNNSSTHTTEPVPLNLILDALKGELRAVNKALVENPNDFAFSCNGNVTPAGVFFKEVIVELAIGKSKTGEFGAEAALDTRPGFALSGKSTTSSSHANTVTIHIKPEITSFYYEDDKLEPGGVADTLTQTMLQLIAVDDTRPCLNIGYEGANSLIIKLEFKTESALKAEGGVDFVVLKVGGEGSSNDTYSHTLTAKIDIRQKPKVDLSQELPQ